MRTKTLLLFVFLLTGMAFSQQGGTGKLTFNNISVLLTKFSEKEIISFLEVSGYVRIGPEFQKGSNKFQILESPDNSIIIYREPFPLTERCEEIRTQAIKAGLKEIEKNEDGSYFKLEGKGLVVMIREFSSIMISRLKK